MKKQIKLGLAAAAVLVMLGAPVVANAAPDVSVTNPHGRTNGGSIDPFSGNEVINPHGRTN